MTSHISTGRLNQSAAAGRRVSAATSALRLTLAAALALSACRKADDPPPIQTAAIAGGALAPAPIEPSWILEGQPVARARTLTVSDDRNFSSTVWDCTAGKFRWRFRSDEVVHILEGEVRVDDHRGGARTLRPGDVALFQKGTTSVWHVPTYVKKLALHRSFDEPLLRRIGRRLGLR